MPYTLFGHKTHFIVMTIKVEASFGEFLDKITILEIKSERISDPMLKNLRTSIGS